MCISLQLSAVLPLASFIRIGLTCNIMCIWQESFFQNSQALVQVFVALLPYMGYLTKNGLLGSTWALPNEAVLWWGPSWYPGSLSTYIIWEPVIKTEVKLLQSTMISLQRCLIYGF